MIKHNYLNKIFLICVIVFFTSFAQIGIANHTIVHTALSENPKGYVPLEPLRGVPVDSDGAVNLPDYLNGMFKIGIGLASVLAVLMIVVAGVQYIGGASSPSEISSANSRIKDAFLGLFVALGSWLLLTTIDPNLIKNTVDIGAVKIDIPNSSITATTGSGSVQNSSVNSSGKVSNSSIKLMVDTNGSVVLDPSTGLPIIVSGSGSIAKDPDNSTGFIMTTDGKSIAINPSRTISAEEAEFSAATTRESDSSDNTVIIDPTTGLPTITDVDIVTNINTITSGIETVTKKIPGINEPCAGSGTLCFEGKECPPGVGVVGEKDICGSGNSCCSL